MRVLARPCADRVPTAGGRQTVAACGDACLVPGILLPPRLLLGAQVVSRASGLPRAEPAQYVGCLLYGAAAGKFAVAPRFSADPAGRPWGSDHWSTPQLGPCEYQAWGFPFSQEPSC